MATGRVIRIHPEAVEEGVEAYFWYRERSLSAARDFKSALRVALKRIEQQPLAWPPVGHGFRRCPVGAFPYALVHRTHDDGSFEVLAIAHGKRKPGYWKRRRGQ